MYCLEKLQRELAHFLDIDLRDLPKVQEILKAQGYSAIKKNDEIIELKVEELSAIKFNPSGKDLMEQSPKSKDIDTTTFYAPNENPSSYSTTNKIFNQGDKAKVLQINADEAITKLHNTQGQPIPKEIDIQTFKNTLTQSVENQNNFIAHLQKKQDAQSRLTYLNLIEPTLKEWDLKLTKGDRKELIKVFNDGDNFFTLLITEQDNKRLITFLPKARNEYIESKIKNADLIQTFTSRASESKAEWTRKANSTTNKIFNQGDKVENKTQLRQATKEILNTLKNKEITHRNGIVAKISSVGIEKMMSDKAIQKSINNGFSISQHFNAIQNIEILFKNSDFLHTEAPKNQSKDIVGVHRYINTENLQEQNAQALITLKESVENGNRIYSLELEELTHPTRLNRSPKSKGAEDSYHDDAGATNTARLFKNPSSYSTTNKLKWQQDGNVLRSVVELDNGEKLLLSKDRLENIYIQSNFKQEITSYDELLAQESLERLAKIKLEDKLAKQIESSLESTSQISKEISFTDSHGKTYSIPKDTADLWLKTFNLESLEQAYIPSFAPEVKQALDPVLQGEHIRLTSGSLLKLMQRDRLEFLPYIKESLETPQAVVRQVDGALIFAKDFRDDRLGKFFASVSKNDNGEWVISSNAPKNLNNLQNKIKEGGEVLYSDLPELPIIAKPELPAKALNSKANLSDIIP